MRPNFFDEDVASRYDADEADMFADDVLVPTVDLLAELAGEGAALELGIGTGRVAIPLHQRGVRVHGIELSEAMAARLRGKSGAEDIEITIGDFASARVDGSFRLAYLVFNTVMNLTSQDDQVACFVNVARHLEPGGCFLVEVSVPSLRVLPPGEHVHAFHVGATHLGFDEYDVANQGLTSHHYRVKEGQMASVPFRYVWPAELDLMARIAGMTLLHRWSGWQREPFTSESTKHVSVWRKA